MSLTLLTIADRSTQGDTLVHQGMGNNLLGLNDRGGHIKAVPFSYTNTTGAALADGSYVHLTSVGPGLILPNSRYATSAFGASRVLNVGFQSYVDVDGNETSSDNNSFLAAADISSATNSTFNNGTNTTDIGVDGLYLDGFTDILAQVTGGTIPTNGTIKGMLFIVSS